MIGGGIEEAFASLEDPRREQGRLHKLLDIITIAICAVISGSSAFYVYKGDEGHVVWANQDELAHTFAA